MGFNFPNSPSVNQTFTPVGGPTYTWDGSVWKMHGTSGVVTANSKNLLVNGDIQISQENGFGSNISTSGAYIADQWEVQFTGGVAAQQFGVATIDSGNLAGNWIRISNGTADATMDATE